MGKKKKNPVLKILGGLFIIFVAFFIANISGYYESKIRDRGLLQKKVLKRLKKKFRRGKKLI